jgi:hypothetical protein
MEQSVLESNVMMGIPSMVMVVMQLVRSMNDTSVHKIVQVLSEYVIRHELVQ